jgi:hypothetical protein
MARLWQPANGVVMASWHALDTSALKIGLLMMLLEARATRLVASGTSVGCEAP